MTKLIDEGIKALEGTFHPFDKYPSQNNGYECGKFFRPMLDYLEQQGITFPDNPKLLGLFSGIGNGEFELARQVGIANKNITLVDKNVGLHEYVKQLSDDHEYFRTHRVGINYLFGRGVFEYLQNPDIDSFSVVTAVGAEYVLDNPDTMEIFIRLLPSVLSQNGFVCIYPEVRDMQDEVWTACGFEEVKNLGPRHDYHASRMYVYKSPVGR